MNKIMTIFLFLLLPCCLLSAISISTEACFSLSPTFSYPDGLEIDSNEGRTSARARLDIEPIKLKLWRFSLSPYGAITKQSDTVSRNDIVFLGYDLVSLGISLDYDITKRLSLGLSFGAGEGHYSYNKTIFALYESTFCFDYLIKKPFKIRVGMNYSKREGAYDLSPFVGISTFLGVKR